MHGKNPECALGQHGVSLFAVYDGKSLEYGVVKV